MKDLILIGNGGFAREVLGYYRAMCDADNRRPRFKGYLDRRADAPNIFFAGSYLGNEAIHLTDPNEVFVLGMADIATRKGIIATYFSVDWQSVNIIHPSATIDSTARLGTGNVIGPHCHIGAAARLGNHNVLNYGCSVGHDSVLGNNNVLASNCQLAGYVSIGSDNFFGISASVIPRTTIGEGNKIQAGTTVTSDVPDHAFYFHRDTNKTAFIFNDGRIAGSPAGSTEEALT
ncbi:acetyltransferase [Andreprevotia chitinilytica]|uniref:acetyltransferase n=1 Tax=Andreprevotia chitinilytica TaxID=396808 RepID=UPI00068C5F21|nr:acetyltransferase [Andreprevotia chitinilytica]